MLRFISPTYKQIAQKFCQTPTLNEVFALCGENLGLQLELHLPKKTWINLGQDNTLAWHGLKSSLRIEVAPSKAFFAQVAFEQSVLDDDGFNKKDRILHQQHQFLSRGYHALWVDVKTLLQGVHTLCIRVFQKEGYKNETCIFTTELTFQVSSVSACVPNVFYLDLWQHLGTLARFYHVGLFSKQHFDIIEHFMTPLAQIGQKVCDVILSDFSWAGQNCYAITQNPSSLYEYNILKVYMDCDNISIDFSALDTYISLCEKLGMAEEINLFGLLGNWKDEHFNLSIEGLDDQIRIRAFDVQKSCFVFLSTKKQIECYIRCIFNHFKSKGWLNRVKVIADQPKTATFIKNSEQFIRACVGDVSFKYAIKNAEFFKHYQGETKNFSVLLSEYVQNLDEFCKKQEQMTWYVCWRPNSPNQFIKSPLIESFLVGYFTYVWGFKGFLRWNYCLWPENPNKDIRYRPNRWPCGDMFFVYPGANTYPEYSLRLKLLAMGIADFNFFKFCENYITKEDILSLLYQVTGKADDIHWNENTQNLTIPYVDDFMRINHIKKVLAKRIEQLS